MPEPDPTVTLSLEDARALLVGTYPDGATARHRLREQVAAATKPPYPPWTDEFCAAFHTVNYPQSTWAEDVRAGAGRAYLQRLHDDGLSVVPTADLERFAATDLEDKRPTEAEFRQALGNGIVGYRADIIAAARSIGMLREDDR